MDIFPLVEIIFYIAALFAPINATEIHASHDKQHITYSKVATGWKSSTDGSVWRQDNTTIHHSSHSIDVSEFVKGAEGYDWRSQKTLMLPGKTVIIKTASGYSIYPNGTESTNDKWTVSYKLTAPICTHANTAIINKNVSNTNSSHKGYSGAHQNPDGTWVVGGDDPGAHQNPDGTWVVGGDNPGAHKNPDGTWVAGGDNPGAHKNPDGTWVAGGDDPGAHQNPDGTWVVGGDNPGAHKNPDGTWVLGGDYPGAHQNPDGTWVLGGDYPGAHQNPDGTWVLGGAYSGAHQNPDGTWVLGGDYPGAHQNPDGTWVVGGGNPSAYQNLDEEELSNPQVSSPAKEPSLPKRNVLEGRSIRISGVRANPRRSKGLSVPEEEVQIEEPTPAPVHQPEPAPQKPAEKPSKLKILIRKDGAK